MYVGQKTLLNAAVLSCFLFHQQTTLSSCTEDGHHKYSWGSVVDEASLIDPEISPTPPLNFTAGVKKCEIWHHFRHRSIWSHPHLKMQQDTWILKQTC